MKAPNYYHYIALHPNSDSKYMEPIHFQTLSESTWFKLLHLEDIGGSIIIHMSLTGLTYEQGRKILEKLLAKNVKLDDFFCNLYNRSRWEEAAKWPARSSADGYTPSFSTWMIYEDGVTMQGYDYNKCYLALRKRYADYGLSEDTTAFITVRFNSPLKMYLNKVDVVSVEI